MNKEAMNEEGRTQLPVEAKMDSLKTPDAAAEIPFVRVAGGVPEGMPGTLGGMAILLMIIGLLCELYVGRDAEGSWQNVLLVVVLCVLVSALIFGHIMLAKRSGSGIISGSMVAFAGVHAVLLPLLCILPEVVLRPCVPFFGLVYALLMLWYGSNYASSVLVAASCALVFTSVLAIPFCLQLGPLAAGVILLLMGAGLLYAALWLHRLRTRRLARIAIAQKRQTLNREAANVQGSH